MSNKIACERCAGSGEIGRRQRGSKEAPGPVPDDARGWVALTCPDCHGEGVFDAEDDLEDEEGRAMTKFKPGDIIAFTASFLKNTGQFTGPAGARRGVYVKADQMPGFARVRWGDEEARIAEGAGNYAEEDYCADIREHGSLVCEKNICRVGSDKFACNDI